MWNKKKKKVKINTDSITLDQFLKWSGVTATGGEAKKIIRSELVKVNGKKEVRRGRRLYPGDKIEIGGEGGVELIIDSKG